MGWDGEGGGRGFRMGNTCKSMADSCQCMAKPLQYCKVISLQLIKINEKKLKIKDRDSMDLTETEEIKKRWQEYTEELCKKKKIFMTQIITMI